MKKIILLTFISCLSFSVSMAAEFTIAISGFAYSPASLNVQVGDQVTIQASSFHPFIEVSQANWDLNNPEPLAGGLPQSTATFTFTATPAMVGTIYYGCESHLPGGMKGTIVVTTVLPLKLTTFSAKKAGGAIQLAWRTEAEVNTLRFEIEKSTNGTNFKNIGAVNANGNANNTNNYTFNESAGGFTTNFYRLKLIDISGSFAYSDVVRISSLNDTKTITLSPNPVKDILTIYTDSDVQTEVNIYNLAGSRILRKNFNNSTKIDVSLWESGIYYVKSKIDGKTISKSFVVNHL